MAEQDDTATLALKELRQTLLDQNPTFLGQCELESNRIIEGFRKHGDSGKVLLMFLALRISALSEKDEL